VRDWNADQLPLTRTGIVRIAAFSNNLQCELNRLHPLEGRIDNPAPSRRHDRRAAAPSPAGAPSFPAVEALRLSQRSFATMRATGITTSLDKRAPPLVTSLVSPGSSTDARRAGVQYLTVSRPGAFH